LIRRAGTLPDALSGPDESGLASIRDAISEDAIGHSFFFAVTIDDDVGNLGWRLMLAGLVSGCALIQSSDAN
jgi:hypothetical protein